MEEKTFNEVLLNYNLGHANMISCKAMLMMMDELKSKTGINQDVVKQCLENHLKASEFILHYFKFKYPDIDFGVAIYDLKINQ